MDRETDERIAVENAKNLADRVNVPRINKEGTSRNDVKSLPEIEDYPADAEMFETRGNLPRIQGNCKDDNGGDGGDDDDDGDCNSRQDGAEDSTRTSRVRETLSAEVINRVI